MIFRPWTVAYHDENLEIRFDNARRFFTKRNADKYAAKRNWLWSGFVNMPWREYVVIRSEW